MNGRDGAIAGKADEPQRTYFMKTRALLKLELRWVRKKKMFVDQTSET